MPTARSLEIKNLKLEITRRRRGFTLIEVLVVIAIIGVLAGLALFSFQGAFRASRDAQRKAHLQKLATALAAYYSANGSYPVVSGTWRGLCTAYNNSGAATNTGSNGYIPGLAPDYIDILPSEPTARANGDGKSGIGTPCAARGTYGGDYCYLYQSDAGGANYKLLAHCTPESTVNSSSPLYDPFRTGHAWKVTSDPQATATW